MELNRKRPNGRTQLAGLVAFAGLAAALGAAPACAKALRDPALRSSGVLVVDESDSSVLVSRHADVASPIASITKLMTALVVLDANQPMDEQIRVSQADVDVGRGKARASPWVRY
jgi:serine-type D-Ala-D-Ala endopeptidase (penicillin-binding protein 7)